MTKKPRQANNAATKDTTKGKSKRKTTSPPPDASRTPKKTKRSTSVEPASFKGKTKNELEIRNLKDAAKKNNMYGVRVCNKNMENAGPVLAGYLFLKDTTALRDLLEDSDLANGILKVWADSRKKGFGVAEKNVHTTWQKQGLWNFIRDPNSLTVDQVNYTIPLPHGDPTLDGNARGYVSWIVTMVRLMETIPECFEGEPEETPATLCGRTYEDWNRAYELMRAYWRYHSEARKATVTKENEKRQTKKAEEPLFLQDSDYAGVTTEEEAKLTAVNLGSYMEVYDEESEDDEEEESSEVVNKATVERSLQFDDQFQKSFRHIPASLQTIDQSNYRPRLDYPNQVRLLSHIGRHAQVMFPPAEDVALNSTAPVTSEIIEQTRASGVEEVLGDADNVATHTRESFWSLMNAVNRVSAIPPSYETACTELHLDPKEPKVPSGTEKFVTPYPWQIVAVAWIYKMEQTPLRGCLVADDMGLGKTLTALLLVILSSNLRAQQLAPTSSPMFKPTLIVCPSSAFGTWKLEISKFFPNMNRKYYMGSPNKGSLVERSRVLPTKSSDLRGWVNSLDRKDPATAKVVVLTTYTTWLKRTIHVEGDTGQTQTAHHTDQDEEDNDNEPEESDEVLNKLQTDCADLFYRVICDEAHKLKSNLTKTSRAIKLLNAEKMVFMSATPMINKPLDLTGVLSLLWKDDFAAHKKDPSLEDFESAKQDIDEGKLTAVNLPNYLYLLDPITFRHYAQPSGGAQMDAQHANVILPPILTIIQLRRTMSDSVTVMGKDVRVAADVPPYKITTVELKMSNKQEKRYRAVHKNLVRFMRGGGDPETGEGHLDQGIHRLLCHASFNPLLSKFSSKLSAVKNVNAWSERFSDFGCAWYHKHTRSDDFSPGYRDRVAMALYMSLTSVKLEWLAGMLHNICNAAQAKVILFHDWPLTLWNTTAFVLNLGFPAVDIRSSHSLAERDAAAREFNDPESPVKVLITSVRTMSASVNLQQACHHMIFLDIPGSANTTLQAIGRIFRLGQTHEQKVWIATVDHTYDQVIQARAARKMVSQIAGQGNVTVTDEDIAAHKVGNEGVDDETAKARVIEAKASDLYVRMFGQRDSRLEWGDFRNLEAKDALRKTGSTDQDSATRTMRSAVKAPKKMKPREMVTSLGGKLKIIPANMDSGAGPSTGNGQDKHDKGMEHGQNVNIDILGSPTGSHKKGRVNHEDAELQEAILLSLTDSKTAKNQTEELPQQHPDSTAPVVKPVENSSSKAPDLPWLTYLKSNDPSHSPDNAQLEDADGEASFPDYFEDLDIDDTSTLEAIHKAYKDRREEQKSSDTFQEQLAELDVALKVTTSPHLRQQWMETYAKKIRARLRRKPDEPLQISIPVDSRE